MYIYRHRKTPREKLMLSKSRHYQIMQYKCIGTTGRCDTSIAIRITQLRPKKNAELTQNWIIKNKNAKKEKSNSSDYRNKDWNEKCSKKNHNQSRIGYYYELNGCLSEFDLPRGNSNYTACIVSINIANGGNVHPIIWSNYKFLRFLYYLFLNKGMTCTVKEKKIWRIKSTNRANSNRKTERHSCIKKNGS